MVLRSVGIYAAWDMPNITGAGRATPADCEEGRKLPINRGGKFGVGLPTTGAEIDNRPSAFGGLPGHTDPVIHRALEVEDPTQLQRNSPDGSYIPRR